MPHKSRGKKRVHDIAPLLRGHFLETLQVLQRRTGKRFPEIMADMFQENPYKFLHTLKPYLGLTDGVKVSGRIETDNRTHVTFADVSISAVDEILTQAIVETESKRIASNGEDGSVFSAALYNAEIGRGKSMAIRQDSGGSEQPERLSGPVESGTLQVDDPDVR